MHTPWLSTDRIARFKQFLADGDPTAIAIHAAARRTGMLPETGQTCPAEEIVAAAVLACLEDDRCHAERAATAWLALAEAAPARGNLGRADVALAGAAVQDAVVALVPDPLRDELRRALRAMALDFREPDLAHGDPHIVTNNHWGVSHAGAAMAAMAVHDGTPESTELVAWARGRVRAYLRLHGDAGLYHEGIGYQLYPAAFWLPFILASRGFDGTDELACHPNLRSACTSLYALTRPSRTTPDGAPHHGSVLSWNDAGSDWCDSGAAVLLAALAPTPQRGALRTLFDHRNGVHGDGRFGPRHAGLFFALAAYPFDAPRRAPDKVLPHWVVDARQGYVVARNRYRDADDAILGGYGRCTHPGGHAHDDAGSLRLAALGHDWIVGGGQNRGQAEWQSLVTPADGDRPQKPFACGALAWCEPSPAGGVFGFDLRRPSQAYAERWVAVRFGNGNWVGVTDLAVLDTVDDHTERAWHWNLSFAAELAFVPHADGAGFELVASDGARLSSRFVGQLPSGIELLRMPDSSRTFQAGQRVEYPGLPFVRAHFPNHPHRAIYWVARVRRGDPAAIRLESDDSVDLLLDGLPWQRPFGDGIARSFSPQRGGTPSRHPTGFRAY